MKRIFLLLPMLFVLPAPVQAQRFPYHSDVFFQQCAHLNDARHDESSDALVNDISCARYIEGFETGYLDAAHLPASCMADPLSLFNIAAARYSIAPKPDEKPTEYLAAAVLSRCKE